MAESYHTEEIEKLFTKATEYVKQIAPMLNSEDLLEFYGFYKQVTVGPCTAPKPSWYNFEGKQKWNAWSKLDQLPKTSAMQAYCEKLQKINVNWLDDFQHQADVVPKQNWVTTSCLPNLDAELNDSDKNIFEWVKEGNIEKVKTLSMSLNINELDETGLSVLHWAADRGNLAMVDFLVTMLSADVNVRDNDGQTPLHYAVSCDHLTVVDYLLKNGGKPCIKDNSGTLPLELSDNKKITELLNSCSGN